jgi:glycerol-3-phosphate acyltransferase PlsY
MIAWLLLPATYLLGSVSFAWIAGRIKGIDIRQHGSGNLGATNAGRVLGRKWGFAVFAADVLKGLLPVLLARWLVEAQGANASLPVATAAAAILGHSFTCFHGFKGGKAVATAIGVLTGLVYVVAAITFCTWVVTWAIGFSLFRLSPSTAVGPASVMGALVTPVGHLLTFPEPWALLNLPLTIFIVLLSALVVVRHRSNIQRLFSGQAAPTPPEPPAQA